MTVDASVRATLNTLGLLSEKDSGTFVNWEGAVVPWWKFKQSSLDALQEQCLLHVHGDLNAWEIMPSSAINFTMTCWSLASLFFLPIGLRVGRWLQIEQHFVSVNVYVLLLHFYPSFCTSIASPKEVTAIKILYTTDVHCTEMKMEQIVCCPEGRVNKGPDAQGKGE